MTADVRAGAAGRTTRWRRRDFLVAALVGAIVLSACAFVARHGTVSSVERRVFRAINDLPDWLYRAMWCFQQFGNLAAAVALALLVVLLLRRWRLLTAILLAVVAKLALERVVKSVVERQRPGTSIGNVIL